MAKIIKNTTERLNEPDHDNRKADHAIWLMSIPPGENTASELNPLIA